MWPRAPYLPQQLHILLPRSFVTGQQQVEVVGPQHLQRSLIVLRAFQLPVRQRLRHNFRYPVVPADNQYAFAMRRLFRPVRFMLSIRHL
jgi:hypothetical protein